MMDNDTILRIVGEELSQSAGGNDNEFIDSNRKQALAYYLGQKIGNEVEGRSTVVSTDVADAIEWIMPEIVEQFTKNNEVVTFDATSADDEIQADLESKVVYDIFMKDNPGFIIMHQVFKDALMQKNGITKTFFEDDVKIDVKQITGLTDEELEILMDDDRVELMEKTTEPDYDLHNQLKQQHRAAMKQYGEMVKQVANDPLALEQLPSPPPEPEAPIIHNIKVKITHTTPKVVCMAVPPEEFRINRQHNTPSPEQARFTAHVTLKTASDLRREGIPQEVIDELPRGQGQNDDDRDYRFYHQNETVYPNREVSIDSSMYMYEISECYMHIDCDEDGIAEFRKINVAGGDNPTHILSNDEMDIEEHPFRGYLAIMMSHKFFGLSIFDRLKQLQEQKTALLRNILDNLYLQNNQRVAVLEGQVNLDDLMISRPGGIIRQVTPGAVEPIVTPAIGQDAYQMMEYLDQVRAGRVGVNPEGPLNIQDLGNRVGSEGVAQLMTAREAVVGLIVKVLAETGFKPNMYLIRNLARNHLTKSREFRHRGSWHTVHPTKWKRRSSTTAQIGTGSGNNQAQLSALQFVIEGQAREAQDPNQTLVIGNNKFNSWKKFCNLAGLKDPELYFTDPGSPEGQQAMQNASQMMQQQEAKNEEMRVAQLEMQAKISNAELGKSKAEQQNVMLDAQLESVKIELDQVKAKMEAINKDLDRELEREKLRSQEAIKITEIESKEKIEITKAHQQNKAGVS